MACLNDLTTEKRNTNTMNLDEMSPYEIITVMNNEDKKVIEAVHDELSHIEQIIKWTSKSLESGGRIIYLGAGTSGRIGILDAVECPPTFGVSYNTVVGVIAGGEGAFVKAKEGAEDSFDYGKEDLKKANLTDKDVVIGLSASGRTPYVIGGLKYAGSIGCKTASIACNKNSEISKYADCAVEIITGPEILSGSTRLKAGTAEKMVLNMISTVSMVNIGKVYENLMVDVRQTNKKLVTRAENIVMQAVGCTRETAKDTLKKADGEAKVAIIMLLLGCDAAAAKNCLIQSNGKVKNALTKINKGKKNTCESD